MTWVNPLEEQIRVLIALDQVDRAILRMTQERIDIRANVKKVKEEIESFHTGLAAFVAEEKTCTAQQKTAEDELRRVEKKIKKLGDFSDVGSAKEYEASQREHETLVEKKDALEEEILSCMEQIEELTERKTAFQKNIAERRKSISTEYEAWKADYEKLGKKLEEQKQDRELIIPQLDDELRADYKRAMQRYGDRTVATVVDDRCTGCQLYVPPQHVVDVLMGRGIHTCQHCIRFILPSEILD